MGGFVVKRLNMWRHLPFSYPDPVPVEEKHPNNMMLKVEVLHQTCKSFTVVLLDFNTNIIPHVFKRLNIYSNQNYTFYCEKHLLHFIKVNQTNNMLDIMTNEHNHQQISE